MEAMFIEAVGWMRDESGETSMADIHSDTFEPRLQSLLDDVVNK